MSRYPESGNLIGLITPWAATGCVGLGDKTDGTAPVNGAVVCPDVTGTPEVVGGGNPEDDGEPEGGGSPLGEVPPIPIGS